MKRTTLGIFVIICGVLILLANYNIFDMSYLLAVWWPVLLIVLGLFRLFNKQKNYFWAFVLIIVGAMLLLRNLNVMLIDITKLILPGAVIVIGLAMFRRGKQKPIISDEKNDDVVAVLSGIEHHNETKEYTGGNLTAVMGGGEIDLSNVTIKKEARIDIVAVMGGFEIRVPKNAEVVNRTMAVLGGVENKTNASGATKNRPTIYLDGFVALGGVEIKR